MPPELVTRLGIGTFTYFLGRGHSPDWVELAEVALAAAESINDPLAVAIARMDLGIAMADLEPDRDSAAVRAHLSDAIAESRALDHAHGLAMCLMNSAEVLEAAGDVAAAVAHNEEALAICARTADFPGGEAVASANLGSLHCGAGDRATAQTYYERSLALNEEIGYAVGVVQVLHRIGEIHHADGRSAAAEEVLTRCVALCREHGYPVTEAAAQATLGFILRDRSDVDGARAYWHAALAGYEKYGKLTEAAELRRLV
jgi:tetratricopeptide (TPR) repeat protein